MLSAVTGRQKLRREGGSRPLRLVLTALLGLSISLTAFIVVRDWELARMHEEFRRDAREHARALRDGLTRDLETLATVGAFVVASETVTDAGFGAFVDSVRPDHPAIGSIAWAPREAGAPRVTGAEGRAAGDAGRAPGASHETGASFPIRHVDARAHGEALLGLDLASDPASRVALARMSETGKATAAAPGTTLVGAAKRSDLTVFHPVYRAGAMPRDAAGRNRSPIGIVVAVLGMDDVIESALQTRAEAKGLDIYVYDAALEAGPRLMHFHPSRLHQTHEHGSNGVQPLLEPDARSGLHLTRNFDVAGRQWTALFRPAAGHSIHAASLREWQTLVAGLVITAILVAYLWILSSRTRERKQAEELSRRFGRIVDNSFDEIYIFDGRSYRFIRVSQGALHNLGYTEEEIYALTPWDLKPEFDAESFAAIVESLRRGDEDMLVFETRHARKNGTLYPVEVRLQLSRSETPPVFVAIVADISDRKVAEEAMEVAMQEAELANRAKSEFLANMSHELRTPLNAIIGFSEIIQSETFGPVGSPKYRDYVSDIHESGKHLLALINDVLDLSKIEAGQMQLHEQTIDVPAVIRSAMGFMAERAREGGVTLAAELGPDPLPLLLADRRMVMQILANLLSNAVKFTPSGGRVAVKAWYGPHGGYVVQVVDNGIGMALDDIPKALARFGQVDSGLQRAHEGTGLGLPLTKSLTELHGGSLDLQSEIGVGTTVTVRFPAERVVGASTSSALAG
jgi:PAS domain S-box-containing protein